MISFFDMAGARWPGPDGTANLSTSARTYQAKHHPHGLQPSDPRAPMQEALPEPLAVRGLVDRMTEGEVAGPIRAVSIRVQLARLRIGSRFGAMLR